MVHVSPQASYLTTSNCLLSEELLQRIFQGTLNDGQTNEEIPLLNEKHTVGSTIHYQVVGAKQHIVFKEGTTDTKDGGKVPPGKQSVKKRLQKSPIKNQNASVGTGNNSNDADDSMDISMQEVETKPLFEDLPLGLRLLNSYALGYRKERYVMSHSYA